ncbi:MAG: circularly permuted type 2 ATP-grasp protein [Planctomycetaceae bacterium]|nr:circularly permuted type 2 ATP-grasp protein [Planctomycetaceae bacterium]
MLSTRQPRAHVQKFIQAINHIGRDEFESRWEQVQRSVQENDFAYSGYIGDEDRPRPWELDALPVLIPAKEWDTVSEALCQRARLFDLTLKDLYGDQRLLKEGVIPSELLYSHSGFQRGLHRHLPADQAYLHFYAADLARSADGQWWVLSDRTEAPSGVGFALENRVLVSRMLPEAFQQCQVERLAPFFITAQDTLRKLAPHHTEDPRVVLLSNGPASKNYFEDAYLARYLGYTLVEGGDLTVRNNQVMLKTLAGLLPVDVIFRRQNSRDCDPLELDPHSAIGVSGLTEAVREGNVAIANSLGSGLIESGALMAFLPALCKVLLDEELKMPTIASWWCGQPKELQYVLEHLDTLIVEPAFRNRGKDGATRDTLAKMSRKKLKETIKANPSQYVAREKVYRSSMPVWDEPCKSAYLALRGFAVADGDSYDVMRGALARTSYALDPLELSIRKGEGSKDTWILSETPVEHVSLLEQHGRSTPIRRSGAELPSRAADNLYWLGRQLERAGAYARVLRSSVSRMSGESRSASDLEIPVLIRCLAEQGQIEPDYAIEKLHNQLPRLEAELPKAVFDKSHPSSLRSVVDELFRLGSIVRDRISLDTWRTIRRIDKGFRPVRFRTTNLSDLLASTDELITELAAFTGIVMESMTRTQAFRFLEMGRRLERSVQIVSLLKTFFIPLPEVQGPVFETVLEVSDSIMTYRSRYRSNLQLPAVLDLLLTDETNPRSLLYQFAQLSAQVDQLPRKQTLPGYTLEQRIAMELLHSVQLMDIEKAADVHGLGNHQPLEQNIIFWEEKLPLLSEAISHRYLIHATHSHQLFDITPQ